MVLWSLSGCLYFFPTTIFVLYRPSCTSLFWIPHFRRQFAVKVCRHNRGRSPLIFGSCCICCIQLQRQELEGVLSSVQVLLHLITFNRSIEATYNPFCVAWVIVTQSPINFGGRLVQISNERSLKSINRAVTVGFETNNVTFAANRHQSAVDLLYVNTFQARFVFFVFHSSGYSCVARVRGEILGNAWKWYYSMVTRIRSSTFTHR